MTKEQFENKCYEAYQLDWMISHGYSLSDYRKLLSELASECIEEEPIEKLPTNAEETKNLFDAAEEMFQDEGFGSGSLFVCKEEFLNAEYLDAGYMDGLLSVMFDGKNFKHLWERFTGLKLAVINELLPGVNYTVPIKDGHLDISVSQDPDYPGVDMEYISDKEEKISDDGLYIRPRILVENNENVLRAVVWGDYQSDIKLYMVVVMSEYVRHSLMS